MKCLASIWLMLFVASAARAGSYSTGVPLPPQTVSVTGTVSASIVGPVSITGTVFTSSAPNANGSMSTVSVSITESAVAAPANSVGVLLEGESGNATNIRWGVSNSAGAILSSTVGVLMEPGRDTGYVPIGAGTFLHIISVSAGTNKAGIQWVLSQ